MQIPATFSHSDMRLEISVSQLRIIALVSHRYLQKDIASLRCVGVE